MTLRKQKRGQENERESGWLQTLLSVLLGGALSFVGGWWTQSAMIRHERNQYVVERLRRADEIELQALQDLDNLRRAVLHRRNVDELPESGFAPRMMASHIIARHAPQAFHLALRFSRLHSESVDILLQYSALMSFGPPGAKDSLSLRMALESSTAIDGKADSLFSTYSEIADSIDAEISRLTD